MKTFDLENAIKEWRAKLSKNEGIEPGQIEELESHLRDKIEHFVSEGFEWEAAFLKASQELIRDHDEVTSEYYRFKRGEKKPSWRAASWVPVLLPNYLKIAIRNLQRNFGFTFINITGLAVGIACCMLILLHVRDELAYDSQHELSDQIFRVVKGSRVNTPELWGPALVEEIPEVQSAVRFSEPSGRPFVIYDKPDGTQARFVEQDMLYADTSLFEVFSWPLVQGETATALERPYTVSISEKAAKKYFGTANPMGKVLNIRGVGDDIDALDYEITGVFADIPRQSHIQADFFISFASIEDANARGEWGTPWSWTNPRAKTYLLLNNASDAEQVLAAIPAFLERHIDQPNYNYTNADLQNLSKIHLYSNLWGEFEANGNITYVYLFFALAIIILLIACINFTNLTTARSQARAKEVGMRKTLGAGKKQLAFQFLGESVFMSIIALGIALLVMEIFRPIFNDVSGKTLVFDYYANIPMLLVFLGIALLVGLLSGSYPALLLSSFKPVKALKGGLANSPKGVILRKGLVMFQFAISIGLMGSTLIVFDQLNYLQDKDLGFESEQVMVIPFGGSQAINRQAEFIRDEIVQHPNVVQASASHSLPSQWLNRFQYRPSGADPTVRTPLMDVSVDFNFMETLDMKFLAGRSFSEDLASDSNAFVLNASAVAELGLNSPEEAIGQQIEWLLPRMGFQGPVIGVVEDFHFGSLHDAIPPISFHISRFGSNFFALKVKPEQLTGTISYLNETWTKFEPNYPFDYYFMDEHFHNLYQSEARLGQTFAYFSILAILIACLGLFGLASYSASRRTKEIGIRKVLGAKVQSIVVLISKEFLKPVAWSFLIICPITYLVMNSWLKDFPYHIEISLITFIWVGVIATLTAILTVSFQSIKAALSNPVKSLRSE